MMPKDTDVKLEAQRLLTPSKITAWLECGHSMTLQGEKDAGRLQLERHQFGSFARLVAQKGDEHERACRAELERLGKRVVDVPAKYRDETFAAWVDRVAPLLQSEHDVLYQMPLSHDGVRGVADFLERVVDTTTGDVTWVPVDAKLARTEAKAGHVLQLCFYAEAVTAQTGSAPEHMYLWLGNGERQKIRSADVMPYWRRLRGQLAGLVSDDPPGGTTPEPCSHCDFCEFAEVCESQWRGEDSLVYVANLRASDRRSLEESGVLTLAQLATTDPSSGAGGLRHDRLASAVRQAALQEQSRTSPSEVPSFRMLDLSADDVGGFAAMPEPDSGDMFFDVEGHPFWRADTGLIFLFGWLEQTASGDWEYRALWAHDQADEAWATKEFVEYVAARRARFPGMHVYHFNHTERSALERLSAGYGAAQTTLGELVDTGAFVDLLEVVRGAMQIGVESYGLKYVERLTGYERGHDIDRGAGAVVEYDRFMRSLDESVLDGIAAYNEDDVRATMALRDWLVAHRPEQAWRSPSIEPGEDQERIEDQLVEALHGVGPDTPEHLLGDVLGYWRREETALRVTTLARISDDDQQGMLENPAVIAGLRHLGQRERTHKTTGATIDPSQRFSFPPQALHDKFRPGAKLLWPAGDGVAGIAYVIELEASGSLEISWNARAQEIGCIPGEVTLYETAPTRPKPAAVAELANQLLDPDTFGPPNPVSVALLRRDLPKFAQGCEPPGGTFSDDIAEMSAWAPYLDRSVVAVQGPPGTGKTYRGAHLVRALLQQRLRVGVVAFSHAAIGNFVAEVVAEMRKAGELGRLNAVRNYGSRSTRPDELEGVTLVTKPEQAARPDYNLVAATAWTFAGDAMHANPVDVLIVDEAGQLALADAIAAARSARSLVLLGDPLQLSQVSQASHPGGSGASVLEHVLGPDEETMPEDRGVFLSETRRMHPDVCRFISDAIYKSKLTTHPDCAVQATAEGTGLRWLQVDHAGRSTESVEEAAAVAAEIRRLLGQNWTDHQGRTRALSASDFMVVAPYNDQVRLIQQVLATDPATRQVAVGTVDKFQGQEAAVVFFTMTSSSAADAPRGTDFLFSRHRLNVAVSRARCLAYLVCTGELANSRARNLDEMRLFATLCSFIEYSS